MSLVDPPHTLVLSGGHHKGSTAFRLPLWCLRLLASTPDLGTSSANCLLCLLVPHWRSGHVTYLDDLEAQETPVEHDDFVFVGTLVHHVPQGQQLLLVGQHRTPPGWVSLVADHDFLLEGLDGLIENGRIFILIRAGELVLVGRAQVGSVRPELLVLGKGRGGLAVASGATCLPHFPAPHCTLVTES